MDVYIYVCGCVHIYEYINKMQSTSNQKGDKVVAGSLFIYYYYYFFFFKFFFFFFLFLFFCFVFFLFIKNIYTYIDVYSTSEKKEVSVISKIFKWGVL